MADIVFYNTKSDKRKIKKSITKIYETVCRWKENTSLYNPTLVIRQNEDLSTIRNVNYIKWGEWYYFVNDVRLCNGNILEFDCEIDVLMSWKDEILNIKTVIERSESSWNKYIDDSEFMGMSMERNISKKVIGSIGTNHSYVLTVNGGV